MIICRRFIISGRVQGVGYRYFAIRAARRVGVAGTVKNLLDGTVEAIAEGSETALNEFRSELERGPSYGHVSRVDETDLPSTGRYSGFDVLF
ncbi:MAG TPA: acylphosphatase [Blastocatellia bacterium]|nr:acylphosphatase [Blastocatellia bacterium]